MRRVIEKFLLKFDNHWGKMDYKKNKLGCKKQQISTFAENRGIDCLIIIKRKVHKELS